MTDKQFKEMQKYVPTEYCAYYGIEFMLIEFECEATLFSNDFGGTNKNPRLFEAKGEYKHYSKHDFTEMTFNVFASGHTFGDAIRAFNERLYSYLEVQDKKLRSKS